MSTHSVWGCCGGNGDVRGGYFIHGVVGAPLPTPVLVPGIGAFATSLTSTAMAASTRSRTRGAPRSCASRTATATAASRRVRAERVDGQRLPGDRALQRRRVPRHRGAEFGHRRNRHSLRQRCGHVVVSVPGGGERLDRDGGRDFDGDGKDDLLSGSARGSSFGLYFYKGRATACATRCRSSRSAVSATRTSCRSRLHRDGRARRRDGGRTRGSRVFEPAPMSARRALRAAKPATCSSYV